MNAEQSNATQEVKDSESNNNYPTDNTVAQTVQNGTTASGQETQNVSETSSAKQRREEMMKKFDIEFKTKVRLEKARFEKKRLELEMQMKELEGKHQPLEEERELERKVKRTTLENDDVRSQSTSDRYKSPFNWTTKKRDVSDWAIRIDNLLTPDRSTARFELTLEVARHSHFSQYRSSRDRSSTRQGKVSDLWKGRFWTVLLCCMEHSGEENWKASCDHRYTTGESSKNKPGETSSRHNRSDQFLSYCFELCECAQRVQADWWSAIKLDTLYGSR